MQAHSTELTCTCILGTEIVHFLLPNNTVFQPGSPLQGNLQVISESFTKVLQTQETICHYSDPKIRNILRSIELIGSHFLAIYELPLPHEPTLFRNGIPFFSCVLYLPEKMQTQFCQNAFANLFCERQLL